jgi:hypothetical protein
MKKVLSLLVLLIISNYSKSQSLITPIGESIDGLNINFSYSVGEIAVNSINCIETKFTQGFQQPFESRITAIEKYDLESDDLIYPNPVLNSLNINYKSEAVKKVKIFDNQGKQVLEGENIQKQLNLDFLPSSLYLLVLYDKKNNILGIHKIIKL